MTSTALSEAALDEAPSIEEEPGLEVVVLGATSPLNRGSLFGWGHGVLAADRSVEVTFLLGHQEFVDLRGQVLRGATEMSLVVRAADITAVDLSGPHVRYPSARQTRD